LILLISFPSFSYGESSQSKADINGKTITLAYLNKNYEIQLEEFCSINEKNQNINIDEEILKKKINDIAKDINKPAVDAKITDNASFQIQKEADGLIVDEAKLMQIFKDYLDFSCILGNCIIEIPVNVVKPKLTEEILNQIKSNEISSFTTKFNPKDKNRTENLRISTETLNCSVIYPKEIFSLDKKLGDRTIEKGYKDAAIFSSGKVINDLAGGICQTTTTLYNAALFANLEIVERHKHQMPVSYINKGRDATIYRNVYDLKIKNNTEYPVYIKSYIDNKNGELTVKIFGYKKDFNVKIETVCENINKKSYYKTYRYVYGMNNVLIKKELLSTDSF